MKRQVEKIIEGVKASDGDGVQLTRLIASPELDMLDPFLLMDAFGSDKPQEYIGGFPSHPHRGFETVTYMLAGKMRHKDSAGNSGIIESGGVQWMRAGKGIIHSEMPEQQAGLLAGFQLWVNLPSSNKMDEPRYQEACASDIPVEVRSDQCSLKVIAGKTIFGTQGIIENDWTHPIYWDITLASGASFNDKVPEGYNAFVYVIEGTLQIGAAKIPSNHLATLSSLEEIIELNAMTDCQFLFIAGKPLNESVARGGPFVMNTQEEIQQAFVDYKSGNFA